MSASGWHRVLIDLILEKDGDDDDEEYGITRLV